MKSHEETQARDARRKPEAGRAPSAATTDGLHQSEVAFLQRTAGNQAVAELLQQQQQHSAGAAQPSIQRAVLTPAPVAPPVDAARVAKFRQLIADYKQLKQSGGLSDAQVADVDAAINNAEKAIRNAETVSGKGSTLWTISGVAAAATGVEVADDVTIIGIGDDVAIPFTALAFLGFAAAALLIEATANQRAEATERAIQAVGDAIDAISAAILAAKVGEKVRGLTGQLVIHLARILGITVCGQPPDHQQDPNQDRNHWWQEIKNFLKQILDKGLTDKQLLRELLKKFSEAELAEIREALRQAAELMGEDPPNFPPASA